VHVTTSRRELTTSTVVVHGHEALLVDPAWEPDELDLLADEIDERGWSVSAGVATHAHHDHLLWHKRFGDGPRYASARTASLAHEHRASLLDALGEDWPDDLAELVGQVTVAESSTIPFPEPVQLIEHDGHAPGQCAVWLPESAVLLAGDMLSDVELPLPLSPDDLSAYRRGLEVLEPYVRRAQVLVPGHGRPTSRPLERLDADLRYFDDISRTGDSDDPRRHNPGMAEVHAQVAALVRDSG
jgi:glyoxylase-like metal-dependent hydrolase (beta-lactamase superfamily II)